MDSMNCVAEPESVEIVSATRVSVRYCELKRSGGFPTVEIRRSAEERLLKRLYCDQRDLLEGMEIREAPLWHKGLAGSLYRDQLGRPRLSVARGTGPSVSFTFLGDRVWCALCPGPQMVGIDAAHRKEFGVDYPLRRAFHHMELCACLDLAGSYPAEAAATIWSVKEAVVKALGCGFRLLDPLDLETRPTGLSGEYLQFSVHFSERAMQRYPTIASGPVAAANTNKNGIRLSFAAVDSRRATEVGMAALRERRSREVSGSTNCLEPGAGSVFGSETL